MRLQEWLNIKKLHADAVLELTGHDVYDSHTALRHVYELEKSERHSIHVILPLRLRKHRGFTPWLVNGTTKKRGVGLSRNLEDQIKTVGTKSQHTVSTLRKMQCLLEFHTDTVKNTKEPIPIHAQSLDRIDHFASFDVRIGGMMKRTLTDTGATCSCITVNMVKSLGLTIERPKEFTEDIKGVGGKVNVLGYVRCTVKLGKREEIHTFYVVKESIAGYSCLIGQDFMAKHSCSVSFTPTQVSFSIKLTDEDPGLIIFKRKIKLDEYDHLGSVNMLQFDCNSKPVWGSEKKALLKEIEKGLCVAYKVVVTIAPTDKTESQPVIPSSIQKVIAKHSSDKGTLRGAIPPNTHVKGYECHIDLIPNASPVQIRQYRLTPREKEELINKVKLFIELGWIEPSTSQWCSSVLFVPKPGGKLRFCVDYRKVNMVTKDDKGPIPQQEDLLDSLQGASYFSALDLASGYFQLAIDEESRPITAFPTPLGLFQWRVMPMGLCNAPAIFQRTMNSILAPHIQKGYCLVYLDDIIIYSTSLTDHELHLDAVLTTLQEHNLFCQLPKCEWAQQSIKYLGHIVSGTGVVPDPNKVKALKDWDIPPQIERLTEELSSMERVTIRKQIIHECRRFLGFMNYFARFIPQFAHLAAPLNEQCSEKAPQWTPECTNNWSKLKTALLNATLMYHPVFTEPFHVYSDASNRAIGGVLMQEHDGQLQPVAYAARKMLKAECNYITTEQEILAIVYCFQKWRCYLDGTAVIVHTDHEPLTWLQTQAHPGHRQARWLEYLSRFQYTIIYIKGDKNIVADALSRMLTAPDEASEQLLGDHWPKVQSRPGEELTTGSVDTDIVTHTKEKTKRRREEIHILSKVQRRKKNKVKFVDLHVNDKVCVHRPNDRVANPATTGLEVSTGDRTSVTPADSPRGSSRGVTARVGAPQIDASGSPEGVADAAAPSGNSRCAAATADTPADSTGGSGWSGRPHQPVAARGTPGISILTFAKSVAVGGHTRARSRLAGTGPTWGKEAGENANTGVSQKQNDVEGEYGHRELRNSKNGIQYNPENQFTHLQSPSAESGSTVQKHSSKISSDSLPPISHRFVVDSDSDDQEGSKDESDPSLSSYETLLLQLFDRIKEALLTDKVAKESREKLGLTQKGDLLWKENCIYIPDDLQLKMDLLYWHHDVPWCAHLGIKNTIQLIKRQFWWPKMQQDIESYIKSCPQCSRNKTDRIRRVPPLIPHASPDGCWRVMAIDLITDLPSTSDGNDCICHFVCHFSKMSRLVAVPKTIDARGIARVFFKEIFPHYGMPSEIQSDRDRRWNCLFWKELSRLVGIQFNLTTAYHPQSNGLVERANEVVATALRHYVSAHQKDWDIWLPFVEFAINSSYKDSIQCTPFSLNRITLPANPLEAVTKHVIEGQSMIPETTVFMGQSTPKVPIEDDPKMGERTFVQAHAMFQWAKKCLHIAKAKMKERFDARGVNTIQYKEGDLVWFSVTNLRIRHPNRRTKLLPKYIGPLKVIERVGMSAIKLELPKYLQIHPTVSISQVKPYYPRKGGVAPPVIIDDDQEWEVTAILNHNIVQNKSKSKILVEFKVQWKGDCEDSWHEFSDLENCLDSLERYLLTNCTTTQRRHILKALKPEELAQLSESVKRN